MKRLISVCPSCGALPCDWTDPPVISPMKAALERIANMTDIEADFDGFEARQIAADALAMSDTPTEGDK